MRKASLFGAGAALPILLLVGAAAIALQPADPSSAPARPPTTRPAALDIGSPAPPIRAATCRMENRAFEARNSSRCFRR